MRQGRVHMRSLMRYYLWLLAASQRLIAPTLAFAGMVLALTASDSGPLSATYALVALSMLIFSTWITIVVAGLDDRRHRAVVVVNAGGYRNLLAGQVAAALGCCGGATLLGLVLPLTVGHHGVSGLDVLIGLAAQGTAALAGAGIGLPCSSLMLRRRGVALLLALGLIVAAVRLPPSPIERLLATLQTVPASGRLLAEVCGLGLVTLVILTAVAATVCAVVPRRA